jgi:transglutaminase-like putative cysteine protease
MSTPAAQILDHRCAPWLFAAALATTLPHAWHQPAWLSLLSGVVLAYAGWLWWRNERLPGRWLLIPLVALACVGVMLEFRTLLGRDAGVAMLVLFMSLKLLELRSQRDAMVLITLGYFLLLTHYFYSQSIPTGLWLIGAMTIVTAALVRLHGGAASQPLPTLRYAGLLTLQALPFMLVLYVLFPRISGPLWGLPQDAHSARSGLTEQMSPGSFSDLALSSEIALRVRFDGEIPPRDKLYWRGPVMEIFDGRTWRPHPEQSQPPSIEALSPPISYESTIEANQQRWLLALDAPTPELKEFGINHTLTVTIRQPLQQRARFALSSVTDYRFNVKEDSAVLKRNLALPKNLNPRTLALAQSWRKASEDGFVTVNRALALFSKEDFAYTLQPPLLGENSIDEFLFQSRRGFCEHYAAAFVVLMRAAGIPARVVGGYQGGERNPVDGFLVIRQSDAHAWAEVWLEGKGWVRIDPTAAVSPSRVEGGIALALPDSEALPALLTVRSDWARAVRHRWEAINNAWNQQVLGYNPERQRQFLNQLGLANPDWKNLTALLATLIGLLLLSLTAWTLYARRRLDPIQRLWHRALKKIAKSKVNYEPWETPLALQRRINNEHPEIAPAFAAVVNAYLKARYSADPTDLEPLREAIAQLP